MKFRNWNISTVMTALLVICFVVAMVFDFREDGIEAIGCYAFGLLVGFYIRDWIAGQEKLEDEN